MTQPPDPDWVHLLEVADSSVVDEPELRRTLMRADSDLKESREARKKVRDEARKSWRGNDVDNDDVT